MCGIGGAIISGNNKLDEGAIRRMCKAMTHRGPDDEGIYVNSSSGISIGLGHRRLKIIDLSKDGHQPMSNEDGTIWLVFNGEIYNFKELRIELENNGHIFRSHTDTEVVIHLYEEHGENCVRYLRGMFAFAIWDEKNRHLLLARDRMGKKPLLYYFKDNRFCFASEFMSLFASGLVDREINLEAIDYYLTFGYVPAPLSIYKNIFKLLPAHTLLFKNDEIAMNKYWRLDYSNKMRISEHEAAEEILRLLREAVKIRLYSDVPLGAFLSGGIDSSAVVALMSEMSSQKVKAFTIGFEEEDYSELEYARNIARRFEIEHHEFIIKPKAMEVLPLLVERYGEPYADSSCIPTFYVSKQTKQYVTVALNGDGGDELFAGYERYLAMQISQVYNKIPNVAKKIIKSFAIILPKFDNSRSSLGKIKRFFDAVDLPAQQRYLKWMGIFSEILKERICLEDFTKKVSKKHSLDFISSFLNESNDLSFIDSLLYIDTMTYLPNDLLVKVDIASMANSLEARSPFLDHKLVEFVTRLPAEYKVRGFIKKYILKKAIKDIVPYENVHRRKMGFGVPIGEWLRGELKGFLYETLLSKKALNRGYFRPHVLREIVNQHVEGKEDYSSQLWALLMLELWHCSFIDREG